MKCDNIQRYEVRADYDAGTIDVPCDNDKYGKYFLVDDVMEAIAELKAKLAEKDFEIDRLKEFNSFLKQRICNGDVSRLTWIDDCITKDKEITELKQKLENVQASMYADVVDANMEIRRLKRALWLARAKRADGEFIYWCVRLAMESGFTKSDIRGYSVNTKWRLRTIGEWIEVWKNVKSKCLKKAEEYK